jgi:hypothetical protein
MKLFVASHSQDEALAVKMRLEARGHEVTSRWILSDTRFHRGLDAYTDDERASIAVMDEEDVRAAVDGVVLLAEPPGKMVPGGKHVETGMALALGRPVFVIGRKENIFHWHPAVRVFADLEALIDHLQARHE